MARACVGYASSQGQFVDGDILLAQKVALEVRNWKPGWGQQAPFWGTTV